MRVSAGGGIASPQPRRRTGGKARRAAGPPGACGVGRDRVAVRGEVVVQFWLQPGEAAVTLGAGEEQPGERIPEQLRRFL